VGNTARIGTNTSSLEIPGEWFGRQPAGGRGRRVIRIWAEPLTAGHQLQSSEQQIEAVGRGRPIRLRVGIERPLGHGVAHDEQKLRVVRALGPLAEPALVRRCQIKARPTCAKVSCSAKPARTLPEGLWRETIGARLANVFRRASGKIVVNGVSNEAS
jgi:hypothetical protein